MKLEKILDKLGSIEKNSFIKKDLKISEIACYVLIIYPLKLLRAIFAGMLDNEYL